MIVAEIGVKSVVFRQCDVFVTKLQDVKNLRIARLFSLIPRPVFRPRQPIALHSRLELCDIHSRVMTPIRVYQGALRTNVSGVEPTVSAARLAEGPDRQVRNGVMDREGLRCAMNVRFAANPDLILRFIGVFSRLEYCLKVTRFRQRGDGEAKADWRAFVEAAEARFNPEESPELAEACGYLTSNPPRLLEVKKGDVLWADYVKRGTSPVDEAVWIVKQIRNNLFHGGKFAYDPSSSPERENKLLLSGTILLSHLISVVPEVDGAYQQ